MRQVKAVLLTLTITIALAFVGYFTAYLAWQDLRPWRHYKVAWKRTAGLRKEDDVYVYGLVVGRVFRVDLAGDHQIAELEVEPTVALYRTGTRITINSIDAFGNVAVFIDPGDPTTLVSYGPEDEIRGEISEGFSLASDEEAGVKAGMTESLRDFVRTTDGLLSVDSGFIGRLLNDPDAALETRDGLESLHRAVQDFNDSARRFLAADEGVSALLSADAEQRIVEATGRIRDSIEPFRDGWRDAAQGGEGAAGRFAGDPTVRDATFDAVRTLSSALEAYRTGEGSGVLFASHSNEPADRLASALDGLVRDTEDARRGDGSIGGLFGPGTGIGMQEALANLGRSLENARTSDASTGNFLSSSSEARRRDIEDPTSRIEDTLREMRAALGRLRASQTPNTFQGAVFSVF